MKDKCEICSKDTEFGEIVYGKLVCNYCIAKLMEGYNGEELRWLGDTIE
jgi:hypothetical protein